MMEHEQEKKRMGKPFPYMRPGHKADNSPVPNFHGMPVRACSDMAVDMDVGAAVVGHVCRTAAALLTWVEGLTHGTVDK